MKRMTRYWLRATALLACCLLLWAAPVGAQADSLPVCPGGTVVETAPLPHGTAQKVTCPGTMREVYDHYRAAMQAAGYHLVVEAIEQERGGLAGTGANGGSISVTVSTADKGTSVVVDHTP